MAKYDPLLKRLGRLRPKDFVRFVHPDLKIERVKFSDREFELTHRRVDTLYKVKSKELGEFYLNLEFQGDPEEDFMVRLLVYSGRILEEFKFPVKTVVIFLKSSKSIRELPCPYKWKLGKEDLVQLHYTKIILSEKDWKNILAKKIKGLLPLIPLTKIKKGEEIKALKEAANSIKKIKDKKERKDLAAVLYLISKAKYGKKIKNIKDIIGEKLMEELKDTEIYQEIVEEGEKNAGKELTLDQLKRKFKVRIISKNIENKLELINSLEGFKKLLSKIDKAKSLSEFEKALDKLIKEQ